MNSSSLTPPDSPCLTDAELQQLCIAEATPNEGEDHLSTCVRCRSRLDAISGAGETVPWLGEVDDPPELKAVLTSFSSPNRSLIPSQFELASLSPLLDAATVEGSIGSVSVELELLDLVGFGGMGVVFRAWERSLDREVAVKFLRPEWIEVPGLVDQFWSEAKAMAAIDDDHVLPIYQVSLQRGLPFFVMPLFRGPTLSEFLRSKDRLSFDSALDLAIQATKGLVAVHQAGILHRDLKPGNWLVQTGGSDEAKEADFRLVLCDFGLANRQFDSFQSGFGGTPGYVAPEVSAGGSFSVASDLYSLGLVFGELASAETPPWFCSIVSQLVSDSPEERPESAKSVLDLLQAHRSQMDSRRHRWRFAKAGIILLGSLGVIGTTVYFLDGSGRTDWFNTLARGVTGREFSVRGQWGAYSDLPEAILAARSGGIVEVYGRGPYSIETFAVSDQKLRIRSRVSGGFCSRFEVKSIRPDATPGISVSGSSIELEGIELVMAGSVTRAKQSRAPSLWYQNGGSIILRNCRLELPGGGDDPGGYLVFFKDVERAEMTDCVLSSLASSTIGWRIGPGGSESRFMIQDSQFIGKAWIDIGLSGNLQARSSVSTVPFHLEAKECFVRCLKDSAFRVRRSQDPIRMVIRTTNCLFEVPGGFASAESGPDRLLREKIDLKDKGSVFSPMAGGAEAERSLWITHWGSQSLDEGTGWVEFIDWKKSGADSMLFVDP